MNTDGDVTLQLLCNIKKINTTSRNIKGKYNSGYATDVVSVLDTIISYSSFGYPKSKILKARFLRLVDDLYAC